MSDTLIANIDMVSHCLIKQDKDGLWFGDCYFKQGLYYQTKMGIITDRIISTTVRNPTWSSKQDAILGITETLNGHFVSADAPSQRWFTAKNT